MAQNRRSISSRNPLRWMQSLPFFSSGESDEGNFLVKVKRVKLFGRIKFVWRTRRRFFIDKDNGTIRYQRTTTRWSFRKRDDSFSVKISDVTNIRLEFWCIYGMVIKVIFLCENLSSAIRDASSPRKGAATHNFHKAKKVKKKGPLRGGKLPIPML